MPEVRLDCKLIRDWRSFHDECAKVLGFPTFYGRNMNAWIDCLTSLDSPADGMTTIHCAPPEVVTLRLDNARLLPKKIYEAIVDCAAFVNWRRMEVGEPPVLAIACWRSEPG